MHFLRVEIEVKWVQWLNKDAVLQDLLFAKSGLAFDRHPPRQRQHPGCFDYKIDRCRRHRLEKVISCRCMWMLKYLQILREISINILDFPCAWWSEHCKHHLYGLQTVHKINKFETSSVWLPMWPSIHIQLMSILAAGWQGAGSHTDSLNGMN